MAAIGEGSLKIKLIYFQKTALSVYDTLVLSILTVCLNKDNGFYARHKDKINVTEYGVMWSSPKHAYCLASQIKGLS